MEGRGWKWKVKGCIVGCGGVRGSEWAMARGLGQARVFGDCAGVDGCNYQE